MSDLPLPPNFATVYAALSQLQSADLNTIRILLDEIKTFIEEGEWTRPGLLDHSPVLASTDRDGRVRHYFGAEGYEMGPAFSRSLFWWPQQNYLSGPTVDQSLGLGLVGQASGAQTDIAVLNPSNVAPRRPSGCLGLRLEAQNSSSARCVAHTETAGTGMLGGTDDMVIVMEFRAYISDVTATFADQFMGLHSAPESFTPEATTENFLMFQLRSGTANFEVARANGGGGSVVDTGVAAVADTWYTFRIELHGANTPIGADTGDVSCRMFIDGVNVLSADGDLPEAAATLDPFFVNQANGVVPGNVDLVVSPFKVAWNEVLDGEIPA